MQVASVQKSKSVIHSHISTLFNILFHIGYCRALSRVPKCYTVISCWFSLYIVDSSAYIIIHSVIYSSIDNSVYIIINSVIYHSM